MAMLNNQMVSNLVWKAMININISKGGSEAVQQLTPEILGTSLGLQVVAPGRNPLQDLWGKDLITIKALGP